MARQYHLYILEDSDDDPSEIQEFISLFFQKFKCHPHNRSTRFNVYLPRNEDLAGKTKFENANSAIKNSEMILCIISPWNTHWINFCRQAALYQKIMTNMRDRFIPVFLGYNSVSEANMACPEEIQCQTRVIFSMPWREDENAWEMLGRSIGQPIKPVAIELDGGPRTGLGIQCTDDCEQDQNMSNLSADGPTSPFPVPSPNTRIRSDRNGILETSTSDGTETAVVPSQVSRCQHGLSDASSCGQIVHCSIPDGPGPLSVSRPGGLFPNNSTTSSLRHHVSADTTCPSNIPLGGTYEENDAKRLPSEVTVDILGGQSEQATGVTDRTNPKQVYGDSLRSDECVDRRGNPLPSDVTDDIESSDDDGSVDSGQFTSPEQSDYNGDVTAEVKVQQNGAGVKQNGAEVQKNRPEVQKNGAEVQKNGSEVQKNEADVKQSGPQLKQYEADEEKVHGDSCHCEPSMRVPSDPAESCGHWARCADGRDHQEHSPMADGEASIEAENGPSAPTTARIAALLQVTAQGMMRSLSGLWEFMQYY